MEIEKPNFPIRLKIQIGYLVVLALALLALYSAKVLGHKVLLQSAQNLANGFAEVIPLNSYMLQALTLIFLLVLLPSVAWKLWRSPRLRPLTSYYLIVLLIGYNLMLGIAASEFKINPITGEPTKCYTIFDGEIEYFDITPGAEWQYHPKTGSKCHPITREIAGLLARTENNVVPDRIPDEAVHDLFHRTLGSPNAWYFETEDGTIELYDNEGFHPTRSVPLRAIDPGTAKRWEVQRKERIDAERVRLAAIERAREEAERKRQEKAEAEKQARLEKEHLARVAEEQEKLRQKSERESLLQAALDCDLSAANPLDKNRNPDVSGVPYAILQANVRFAVDVCSRASTHFPGEPRYLYQLGRAYQAMGNMARAQDIMSKLTAMSYPAAYDNLGWIYLKQNRVAGAVETFTAGIRVGSPESMVSLATLHLQGRGVEKDEGKAEQLIIQAAELGHPDAIPLAEEILKKQKDRDLAAKIAGGVFVSILQGIANK